MTPIALTFAALFVIGALALAKVPRYWSAPYWPAEPGAWWPHGRALWKGLRRGEPVIVVGLVLWTASVLALLPFIAPVLRDHVRLVRPIGYLIVVVGPLLATSVLTATIVLWNRPKPLVPPSLRGEPGVMN